MKGIKPIVSCQEEFKSTYLHGFFSPIDGNMCVWEIDGLSCQIFELLLKELSKQRPNELKIIFDDNGSFHSTENIVVPDDIILINIPPYSPELNPAERVWEELKKFFKNKVFKSILELKEFLYETVRNVLTPEKVISLTGYDLYVDAFIGHSPC